MLTVVESALDNTGNAHAHIGGVVFFKQLLHLLCLVGTRGQKRGQRLFKTIKPSRWRWLNYMILRLKFGGPSPT